MTAQSKEDPMELRITQRRPTILSVPLRLPFQR